jgi:hypothetical protein
MNWPGVEGNNQPHGLGETPPASAGKRRAAASSTTVRMESRLRQIDRRVDLDQPRESYQQDRPNIANKILIINAFRHPSCAAWC